MGTLLLFPCNGNAFEALDALGPDDQVLGFIDDDPRKQGTRCHGLPVFDRDALRRWPDARVLAVPGNPATHGGRRTTIESLDLHPQRFARIVHPDARVSRHAEVGHNVLLMAGVFVAAGATVGDHVCVLANSVIHHDARVGAWSLVGSNVSIAGGVHIGELCYVGSGSSLIEGTTVGDRALVGLASTVLRPVEAGHRVAGVPARGLDGVRP